MSANLPRDQKLAYMKLKLDHEREMYKARTERLKAHIDEYNAKTSRWKIAVHATALMVLVYNGSHLAGAAKEVLSQIMRSM